MYKIIQKGKLWVGISLFLVVISIVGLFTWGLKLGIDFTGGSLLEVKFSGNKPTVVEIQDSLKDIALNSLSIQPADSSTILRFQETAEETHQEILTKLEKLANDKNPIQVESASNGTTTPVVAVATNFEELTFTSIGPSIGRELQRKAVYSIILVLIAISCYIAYAFRKVSKPISSWKYGVVTLVALFHDSLITIGCFVVLGKFLNVEVNTSFIAAVLTVMGFSVHDTIVVFDRIRENLPKSSSDFENTVNVSINQTLVRSINTSMTVMLVLACIVVLGGASIKYFALSLLVGIFFGTYSSIFLASPLLVMWEKWRKRS